MRQVLPSSAAAWVHAGARQHLADAGDLLAHLHATDADRHRGRACADAEDMCGIGFADALGQRHGLRVGPGLQHGEIVFAEAGQLRVLADHLGQQAGEGADQVSAEARPMSGSRRA
jgi:hypothetical protein